MKRNIEIRLEEHSDINKTSESSTILVIIFGDMLMFYQIFLSPQLKRIVIISNKYLRVAERLKTYDLTKLGNIKKVSNLHRLIS